MTDDVLMDAFMNAAADCHRMAAARGVRDAVVVVCDWL
jgi:hypothetical protein